MGRADGAVLGVPDVLEVAADGGEQGRHLLLTGAQARFDRGEEFSQELMGVGAYIVALGHRRREGRAGDRSHADSFGQ